MSLSDKIMFQMGDEELDEDNMVFTKEDVKDFIKELKKKLLDYQYQTNPQLNEYCHNNIIKQIDKLSGDALVGVSE